ncbi:MAG: energy transducer TonB [Ignavibacteriota bacterium]
MIGALLAAPSSLPAQDNKFDIAPVLIYGSGPPDTPEAKRANLSGEIILRFTLQADGVPTDISVKKGLGGGLDESAINALSQHRWKPAYKDGKPIALVNTELTFTIRRPVGESPEHRFARITYEDAFKLYQGAIAARHAILAEVDRLQHKRFSGFTLDQQDELLAQDKDISNRLNVAKPMLDYLEVQMNSADNCLFVYGSTLNTKVSDLTSLQAGAVQECISIEQYPPKR